MPFPQTRVCTFNVYNLVKPGVPYYESDPYTAEEFAEKTAWIGAQLDRMAADIVGFQEVFHKDALTAALAQSVRFKEVEPIVLASNEEYGQIKFRKSLYTVVAFQCTRHNDV